MLQAAQLVAFSVVLNVPLAQAVHIRSVVVVPRAPTLCPGAQLVQVTHAVAALPSWSHVPGAHATFGVAAPAQWVPASHGAHTGGATGVAAAICSVPAMQASAGRQLDSLADDVYVPAAQVVHCRSITALGAELT